MPAPRVALPARRMPRASWLAPRAAGLEVVAGCMRRPLLLLLAATASAPSPPRIPSFGPHADLRGGPGAGAAIVHQVRGAGGGGAAALAHAGHAVQGKSGGRLLHSQWLLYGRCTSCSILARAGQALQLNLRSILLARQALQFLSSTLRAGRAVRQAGGVPVPGKGVPGAHPAGRRGGFVMCAFPCKQSCCALRLCNRARRCLRAACPALLVGSYDAVLFGVSVGC